VAVGVRLANWPVPLSAAGRAPVVSDGYHSRADFAAGRSIRIHRGVDIFWKRRVPALTAKAKDAPFGTTWFWTPRNEYERPIIAAADGFVYMANERHVEGGKVTGGAVILQHADGLGTAYHHLARVFVEAGQDVGAGQLLGVMGGSPAPDGKSFRGLVHLHFDVAVDGRFVDPEPFLKGVPALALDAAWGQTSVGHPDDLLG
jgi:murein DD-endopeptidase MepM/ murein hydrolase activator NlpD